MKSILFYKESTRQKLNKLILHLLEENSLFKNIIGNTQDFCECYERLPYVDKNFILSHNDYYTNKVNKKIVKEFTSGSTGKPFECVKTNEERMKMALEIWKERKKIDNKINSNNFCELIGLNAYKSGIDFTCMTDENFTRIVDYIDNRQPRWICLSATMAYYYSKKMQENKIRFSSIKFIEVQGECLEPEKRQFIEQIFEAKVIVQYGLRECWAIAYECESGKLHLMDDTYLIEIDKTNNEYNNEYGELVISSCIYECMPIIKYRTGDLCKATKIEKCKCGKEKTIVLDLLGGRTANLIKGYDGMIADIVFKRILRYSIRDVALMPLNIDSFCVIQKKINEFYYEICVKDVSSERRIELEKALISHTKKILGENVVINIIYTKQPKTSNNGKIKFYTSEC